PTDRSLTGVVFRDANGNGRYDLDEGLAGIRITAGAARTLTNDAGGWSLPVTRGASYAVTASSPGLPTAASACIAAGDNNVEVDFVAGQDIGVVDFQPGEDHRLAMAA